MVMIPSMPPNCRNAAARSACPAGKPVSVVSVGSQITLAAFAATLYPTSVRSTGVSWAHGFARCGSIISVLFAGAMLALHWPLKTMYLLVSIPMFFGCLWILLLAQKRAQSAAAVTPLETRGAAA